MMDEGLTLVLLSVAMLIGCYLAGSIPLALTFSEEKLKLFTMFGAGLLVGTALAVIIPEGVHTMYEQHLKEHASHHLEIKSASGVPNAILPAANKVELPHAEHHDHGHGADVHSTPLLTPLDIFRLRSMIGVALVLGFVFMMLVDQLGGGGHSHTGDAEGQTPQHRHKITATIGLVVHAAADGVALGAAATTSQLQLTMIVFVAIMLHKTPAAFGLVSFLLHEGFDRNRIRRHLLVFALAAPLLSIITYIGLSRQSKEALSEVNATGLALLFSAGTFLYVATVHVLPEITRRSQTTVGANGTAVVREHQGFTKTELSLLVSGSLLPLVMSLGHHH